MPSTGSPRGSQTLQNYQVQYGVYEWIEISSTGNECYFPSNDDNYVYVSLPFGFEFYGSYYYTIYICTNGFVSFTPSTDYSNDDFPQSSPALMIAPYWDDLDVSGSSNVYYKHDYARDCFVIEYSNSVTHGDNYYVGTFEILLYENGNIAFQYQTLDRADGTCGLNYGYDMLYYTQYTGLYAGIVNHAIMFTYTGGSGFPGGFEFPLSGEPDEDFESLSTGNSLQDADIWSTYYNPVLLPSIQEDWFTDDHYASFSDQSSDMRHYSVADVPAGSDGGLATWWVQFEVTWLGGRFEVALWDDNYENTKVIRIEVGEDSSTGSANLFYRTQYSLEDSGYTLTSGVSYRVTIEFEVTPYPSHYNIYVGEYRVVYQAVPYTTVNGDIRRLSFETSYNGYNNRFMIDDIELSWTTGSWYPEKVNTPLIVGIVASLVAVLLVLVIIGAAVKSKKRYGPRARPGATFKPVVRPVPAGMKVSAAQPTPVSSKPHAVATPARQPATAATGRSIWENEAARAKSTAPRSTPPEQAIDISGIEVGPMRPLGTSAFAELGKSGSPVSTPAREPRARATSSSVMHQHHRETCFVDGNNLASFSYACPGCGTLYCKECTDVMARFNVPCVTCNAPLVVAKDLVSS